MIRIRWLLKKQQLADLIDFLFQTISMKRFVSEKYFYITIIKLNVKNLSLSALCQDKKSFINISLSQFVLKTVLRFYINMILLYALILLIIIILFFKFYYNPRKEINRFTSLVKGLGYTAYQQDFAFLSGSILASMDKGIKLHGDALYTERIIHPHFDVIVGNLADKLFVTLVNPDLIKDFLKAENVIKYEKYQPLVLGIKAAFGQGLTFTYGQSWKNKRKLLSKLFTFQLLKENIPNIVQICNKSLDHFDKIYKKQQGVFQYDVNHLTSRMFNLVMLRCFFGCDDMDIVINGKPFADLVTEMITKAADLSLDPIFLICGKLAYSVGLTKQIRSIKDHIQVFRNKLKEMLKQRVEQIEQQKEQGRCTDLIQAIVYDKKKNKEQFSFTDQELMDEFSTFLIAGTDTTSRLVTVMVYYISKYPQVERKLREEISLLILSDEDITSDNLKKMRYLEMVINETLRFYGPSNGIFVRLAQQDNFICNIPIPKGTTLFIQPMGNHYNPKFYKEPEIFRPERWEKQCENLHPYAFLGFSGGPRSCIGKQLALLQAKISVIKILQRYEQIKGPQRITFSFKFIYEADPFLMNFWKKSKDY